MPFLAPYLNQFYNVGRAVGVELTWSIDRTVNSTIGSSRKFLIQVFFFNFSSFGGVESIRGEMFEPMCWCRF